jgi:hypothetical protein
LAPECRHCVKVDTVDQHAVDRESHMSDRNRCSEARSSFVCNSRLDGLCSS